MRTQKTLALLGAIMVLTACAFAQKAEYGKVLSLNSDSNSTSATLTESDITKLHALPTTFLTTTSADSRYVNTAGDTMTGQLTTPELAATSATLGTATLGTATATDLTASELRATSATITNLVLGADPDADLEAATKQYVDAAEAAASAVIGDEISSGTPATRFYVSPTEARIDVGGEYYFIADNTGFFFLPEGHNFLRGSLSDMSMTADVSLYCNGDLIVNQDEVSEANFEIWKEGEPFIKSVWLTETFHVKNLCTTGTATFGSTLAAAGNSTLGSATPATTWDLAANCLAWWKMDDNSAANTSVYVFGTSGIADGEYVLAGMYNSDVFYRNADTGLLLWYDGSTYFMISAMLGDTTGPCWIDPSGASAFSEGVYTDYNSEGYPNANVYYAGRRVVDALGDNDGAMMSDSAPDDTANHDVTGTVGGGLDFDGTDDYVDCGDLTIFDRNKVSISFWFNADAYAGSPHYLFKKGDAVAVAYSSTGPAISCFFVNESSQYTQYRFTPPATGAWVHAVLTYDGTAAAGQKMKMYYNGANSAVLTYPYDNGGTIKDSANSFYIGSNAGADEFNGKLDNLQIFDKALSSTEVGYLYTSSAAGKPALSGGEALTVVGNAVVQGDSEVWGSFVQVSDPKTKVNLDKWTPEDLETKTASLSDATATYTPKASIEKTVKIETPRIVKETKRIPIYDPTTLTSPTVIGYKEIPVEKTVVDVSYETVPIPNLAPPTVLGFDASKLPAECLTTTKGAGGADVQAINMVSLIAVLARQADENRKEIDALRERVEKLEAGIAGGTK